MMVGIISPVGLLFVAAIYPVAMSFWHPSPSEGWIEAWISSAPRQSQAQGGLQRSKSLTTMALFTDP